MCAFGSSNRGCLRKPFGGCLSIFLLFAAVIYLLSSIEFPEINFSLKEPVKSDYLIDMDSTSNKKKISASFNWKFVASDLSKRKYNLSFNLLETKVQQAMQLIDRIGRMSFSELGLNPAIQNIDPDTRAEIVWARIYHIVYTSSFTELKSITDGFTQLFLTEKLKDKDKLLFLVTFVQNIKYDRPGGTLDLLAPVATLAKQFGDCDTKAMLLYVLLERLGIDCAMMWSQYYKHAMLGINIPSRGDYKNFNGKNYYFLETTYPGWAIGDLPPDFRNKRFWFISEIDKTQNFNFQDYNRNKSNNRNNRSNKPSPSRKHK